MNISPDEAQASLAAVQQTRAKMRKLAGTSSYFAIVWGLVCFFGFLATQFLPSGYIWLAWLPLVLAGGVISSFIGYHIGTQSRSAVGARHAFFYLALFGFTIIWLIIMQPLSLKQDFLFLASVILFGGVVSGVLQRAVPGVVVSLAFLAITLIGYYLLPAYFYLWMAVFYGLLFAAFGVVMRLRWR